MNSQSSSDFPSDLLQIKEILFHKCGLKISSFQSDQEGNEYSACSFKLHQKHITFRASKVTPKKIGQFVTIWRRNEKGITQPFVKSDALDFLLISSKYEKNFGLFIFPKIILIEKGVITDKKEGKRGMRVYPVWDQAANKQAKKTQEWQIKYFLNLEKNAIIDSNFIKNLFAL